MSNLLFFYIFAVNITAVIVTCYDKICAAKGKWRISEFNLLLISLIGGSVGMYITMLLIRHKTRHIKFMVGLPIIIACQCVAVWNVWRFINE